MALAEYDFYEISRLVCFPEFCDKIPQKVAFLVFISTSTKTKMSPLENDDQRKIWLYCKTQKLADRFFEEIQFKERKEGVEHLTWWDLYSSKSHDGCHLYTDSEKRWQVKWVDSVDSRWQDNWQVRTLAGGLLFVFDIADYTLSELLVEIIELKNICTDYQWPLAVVAMVSKSSSFALHLSRQLNLSEMVNSLRTETIYGIASDRPSRGGKGFTKDRKPIEKRRRSKRLNPLPSIEVRTVVKFMSPSMDMFEHEDRPGSVCHDILEWICKKVFV